MLRDLPVQHVIATDVPPVLPKLFLLAGNRLSTAKQEFEMLLSRGIIRPYSSQWTSPLHLVPELAHHRVLSRLNSRYPLPVIKDLLQYWQGRIFSVAVVHRAFYQIPVAPEDVEKAAFRPF